MQQNKKQEKEVTKFMKQKSITQTLKRCLCMGLSAAMAFTMMPETQARAEDGNPARAGSVGLTADATTRSQPFERGTGSSTSFGSPSLIVRQVEKAVITVSEKVPAPFYGWL